MIYLIIGVVTKSVPLILYWWPHDRTHLTAGCTTINN